MVGSATSRSRTWGTTLCTVSRASLPSLQMKSSNGSLESTLRTASQKATLSLAITTLRPAAAAGAATAAAAGAGAGAAVGPVGPVGLVRLVGATGAATGAAAAGAAIGAAAAAGATGAALAWLSGVLRTRPNTALQLEQRSFLASRTTAGSTSNRFLQLGQTISMQCSFC